MSIEVTDDVSTEIEPSTTAPEAVTAPENVATPETVVESPATEQVAPVVPQAPVYTPNFKYSVKGQEKEIDEMFRSLIKDAESEKKIKDLFEKADGIDFVKQDRDALKTEYKGFKEQTIPYLQTYHKFTTLRDNGNLGAALQVAGISDEQVFEYALQKLEMEKNPSQANLYKTHTEASLKAIDMESKLQRYEQQEQMQQQHAFMQEIENSIASVKDIATQVDMKLGKAGVFKEEVIAHGILEYNKGNILTVAQATEAIVNKYKPFITPTTTTPAQSAPQATQAKAPIMPNLGTSNVSVIKQKPKNIEDLKKAYQEEVG
jgi:hypothetical protein